MAQDLGQIQRPYQLHLTDWSDLVTSYEQVRAGFVALALERNRRATPFVEQARVTSMRKLSEQEIERIVRLAGFSPDDPDVGAGVLKEGWNGHPARSVLVSGLMREGNPFAVVEVG